MYIFSSGSVRIPVLLLSYSGGNWFLSRAESTRDTYNDGQYINQFPTNTIKVIREFKRIQKKICRHKMSIMFNEICIYIYIYIYIYILLRFSKTTLLFWINTEIWSVEILFIVWRTFGNTIKVPKDLSPIYVLWMFLWTCMWGVSVFFFLLIRMLNDKF